MSASLIELLQNSVETPTGDNVYFNLFLQSCLEHGTFYCQDSVEAVIKGVNKSLNSSYDNEKGLILLQTFLSQISVETFSSNAVSWMTICNKIIHQKEDSNNALALTVLTKLIKLSVKFPEVNKEAGKQIVPKFLFDHVRRKTTSQVSVQLLECLQSCMSEYSGPSGEFRSDIVKLLLATVEGNQEVVGAASRCIPLVAGLGGGGKQGASHKTTWHRQQLALVTLLHSLLNQLYEHVHCPGEAELVPTEDVQLTLESVTDRNILRKSQRLASQFSSVAQFLQAMLLEKFPVAKMVATDAILDVVAHAQKPTLATLGTTREALAVASVLPSIQVAALRLLESLVLCLGRNLVPRSSLVCYLCSQIVHWTHQQHSDWPYAMDKPYSKTRLAAYYCLYSWLNVAGRASHLETVVDKLLPALLADIHAEKPSVRLRVGSKSGKGKKKQQVLVSQEDRSEKLGDLTANSKLCERALLTLTLLLRAASPGLKPDSVASLTSTVLTLFEELPVPYSDANCLSALYQLLLTLCLEPHPRVAPPLAPALAKFSAGVHHPAPLVKATCVAALSSLDKIIHPTAATLYFPLIQDKQKFSRDIEEIEHSMPSPKRMKVDSSDAESIVSIVLEDSEDKTSSVAVIDKNSEETKINSDASEDSQDVVEIIPTESNIQNIIRRGKKVDGTTFEEIVIDEDSENNETQTNKPIEEMSSKKSDVVYDNNSSSNPETNEKEDKSSTLEEVDTISSFKDDEPEKSSLDTKTDVISNQESTATEVSNSADDGDISQMIMDFTDEVNDDTEN